jgi:hypothetical protein
MHVETITHGIVPSASKADTAYHFPATIDALEQRDELTDRTRGWFSSEMITELARLRVAIAGVGGIGGHVADSMVRAGIGHISIADSGTFDYSNVHRQHGASYKTIGESKALATASLLLSTVHSTSITAYPMGVTEKSIDSFLEGIDIVVDAVEFHALGARCLLHACAREKHIPVINGNSVGFGTNIFLFSPSGLGLCDAYPFTLEHAYSIENTCLAGTCTRDDYEFLCCAINSVFLADIPNYGTDSCNTRSAFLERLHTERTASIISTNPKMAGGMLSSTILMYLLREHNHFASIYPFPVFPEYYHHDSALRTSYTKSLTPSIIYNELLAYMHRNIR